MSTLKQPEDNASVWRYMDFTKFVSLLDSSKLVFCRADLFEDPYEGRFPDVVLNRISQSIGMDGENPADREKIFGFLEIFRRHSFVLCWHLNEVESDAMWKIFIKSNEGVAIKTNFGALREQLQKKSNMYLGLVDYDESNFVHWVEGFVNPVAAPNLKSSPLPIFYKRKSFEHERELRAVCYQQRMSQMFFDCAPPDDGVMSVKINLKELVKEVHVSPTAPSWMVDLVKKVLKKYGLRDVRVVHSKLLSVQKPY